MHLDSPAAHMIKEALSLHLRHFVIELIDSPIEFTTF